LVSTSELIQFWRLPERTTVHPSDAPHLRDPRGLDLSLVPQPWAGPLATADIFVLHLNPGLDGIEKEYEEQNSVFRDALVENLGGRSRYLFLDPRFASHPGHRWAVETLGDDLGSADTDRICFLQAVAYHSKTSQDAYRVAPRLPSVAILRKWVGTTLLPDAMAGKVAMVVARAARIYGLDGIPEGPNLVVYRFPEFRRARVTRTTRGGALIRQKLGRM
jgi:hypothetical protein